MMKSQNIFRAKLTPTAPRQTEWKECSFKTERCKKYPSAKETEAIASNVSAMLLALLGYNHSEEEEWSESRRARAHKLPKIRTENRLIWDWH
jgi:hypothetical protein